MNWIQHDFDDDDDDEEPTFPVKRFRRQTSRTKLKTGGNSYSSPIRPIKTNSSHPKVAMPKMNAACVEFGLTNEMLKGLEDIDFFDITPLTEEDHLKPSSSQNRTISSSAPILRRIVGSNESKCKGPVPWSEKYQPTSIDKFESISSVKLKELKKWFSDVYGAYNKSQASRLLLLSGPSGCGKTLAVKLLAKQFDVKLYEYTMSSSSTNYLEELDYKEFTNQFKSFKMFILGTNNSMDQDRNSKLIVIKDFPQTAQTHTNQYRDFFENYVRCIQFPVPIVFIFTLELGSSQLRDRLFPKLTSNQFSYQTIEVKGVGKRAMTKILNSITSNRLPKATIDSLIESCDGDLRNAINVLEFVMAEQNKSSSTASRTVSNRKSAKVSSFSSNDFSFCLGGKDSAPLFFHFLGKILYCKRTALRSFDRSIEKLPEHMSHLQRHPMNENPERLLEQMHDVSDNLLLFLHQNYCHFMKDDIRSAAQCASWMSISDESFSTRNSWNAPALANYAHSICVRGIMFNVPTDAPGSSFSFYKFKKPRFFEEQRRIKNIDELASYWRLSQGLSNAASYRLMLEDLPYLVRLNRNTTRTHPLTSQLASIYPQSPPTCLNEAKSVSDIKSIESKTLVHPDFYVNNPIIEDDSD